MEALWYHIAVACVHARVNMEMSKRVLGVIRMFVFTRPLGISLKKEKKQISWSEKNIAHDPMRHRFSIFPSVITAQFKVIL